MKLTVRIIALLISIVMLVSQLSACGRIYDYFIDVTTDILIENDDDGNYVFEVVYPEVSVSTLSFSLGEEHLREYNEKLVVAKMIFEQNKSENADKFRDVLYELMSLEAYIRTQCDIAYLQYYYDTSDTTAWGNYLYAYDLYDTAHDLFWSFYSQDSLFFRIFKNNVFTFCPNYGNVFWCFCWVPNLVMISSCRQSNRGNGRGNKK